MENPIEIELKFILTAEEERRLLEGSEWISSSEFTDTYYDTPDFSLTRRNIWLRTRNEKFVLKMPLDTTLEEMSLQDNTPKKEIEDEEVIRQIFSLPKRNSLSKDLLTANILPLYTFRNLRRSYKKKEFRIDLDKAIFDDFTYETCEIEIVVQQEMNIDRALEKLIKFAQAHNLAVKHVEGRLIEYLRRNVPAHYAALPSQSALKTILILVSVIPLNYRVSSATRVIKRFSNNELCNKEMSMNT